MASFGALRYPREPLLDPYRTRDLCPRDLCPTGILPQRKVHESTLANAQPHLPLVMLILQGLPDRSRTILTLSALVGAMSLARAVLDESLSREILKTAAELLKKPASEYLE